MSEYTSTELLDLVAERGKRIAELETVEIAHAGAIIQLTEENQRLKAGFQGACYCCEPVGELNVRLSAKNEELEAIKDQVEIMLESDIMLDCSLTNALRDMLKDACEQEQKDDG